MCTLYVYVLYVSIHIVCVASIYHVLYNTTALVIISSVVAGHHGLSSIHVQLKKMFSLLQ